MMPVQHLTPRNLRVRLTGAVISFGPIGQMESPFGQLGSFLGFLMVPKRMKRPNGVCPDAPLEHFEGISL